MNHQKPRTFAGTTITPTDVCRWAQALFRLHSRLAPRFARPEPHQRADARICKGC